MGTEGEKEWDQNQAESWAQIVDSMTWSLTKDDATVTAIKNGQMTATTVGQMTEWLEVVIYVCMYLWGYLMELS